MRDKSRILNIMDNHFMKFDQIKVGPDSFFSNLNGKQLYENFIMSSYRKYEAAIYHVENFYILSQKDREYMTNIIPDKGRNFPPSGKFSFRITLPNQKYAYELVAFLASLKSGVDFMARICSFYMKHVTCRGIKTLLKISEKESGNPINRVILSNREWLANLKAYRDQAIHMIIIPTTKIFEKRGIGEHLEVIDYPLIIPVNPPANQILDTRKSRAEGSSVEIELSKYCIEEKVLVSEDGNTIIDYKASCMPKSEYITIEKFLEEYLSSFEMFCIQLIKAFSDLDFQIIKDNS